MLLTQSRPEINLEAYDSCPASVLREVGELLKRSPLDEDFDWSSKWYIIGRDKGKIVGIVLYDEYTTNDTGQVFPRFIHIVLDPDYKRTKKAYLLLKESEKIFLTMERYKTKQILCYIDFKLPNREMKKQYALKFGYKKYREDFYGEFFYKNILN